MPQLGHGFVGLAIGAATAGDPGSSTTRNRWLGLAVLLACLPDLLEWLARHAAVRLPHSALASVPMLVLCSLAALLVVRYLLREKSRVALAAVVVALASHTLLDMLDGGIPLAWPFSNEIIGPHWKLSLTYGSAGERLRYESLRFLPVLAIGLAVGIIRFSRVSGRSAAALSLAGTACLGGAIGIAVVSASAVAALVAATILLCRVRLRRAHLYNLVPLVPLILVGSVEVYAWQQARAGLACERRGEPLRALAHYERVRDLKPTGTEVFAIYRTAVVLQGLGKEEGAYEVLAAGLENDPRSAWLNFGLAELYLDSSDARYQKPREALQMAEALVPATEHAYLHDQVLSLRERARQVVDRLDAASSGH